MSTPDYWVIKHDRHGTILCHDGCFDVCVPVRKFKTYQREHNAVGRLRKLGDGYTAHAVHPGEEIDCFGKIGKAGDTLAWVYDGIG